MAWWDAKAYEMHLSVVDGELDREEEIDDERLRRAILYARQDIVLVVSQLSSANRQLQTIKFTLFALVAVLIFVVVKGHYI